MKARIELEKEWNKEVKFGEDWPSDNDEESNIKGSNTEIIGDKLAPSLMKEDEKKWTDLPTTQATGLRNFRKPIHMINWQKSQMRKNNSGGKKHVWTEEEKREMAEWLHYELIKINHDWIVQQREEHSGLKAVYLVSEKALELEIRTTFNSNHKEGAWSKEDRSQMTIFFKDHKILTVFSNFNDIENGLEHCANQILNFWLNSTEEAKSKIQLESCKQQI